MLNSLINEAINDSIVKLCTEKKMPSIGNFGITIAKLYDKNGNLVGTTMDCPNPVACAMANNKNIAYAVGILGRKNRSELEDRFSYTKDDDNLKKYYKPFKNK